MKKRILITGAAGFLGSHLCYQFLKEGFRVIAMDNLCTGKLENIESLFPLEDFEFYHHDVSSFIHIPGRLDYILHFASPGTFADYVNRPVESLKLIFAGTHNCLGLARAKNARLLIGSSTEQYLSEMMFSQAESVSENVEPSVAMDRYKEAMRFQEAMVAAYESQFAVETRIARLFNTYGPKMRLDVDSSINTFFNRASKGVNISLANDTKTGSFCFVGDVVEGICQLLTSSYSKAVDIGTPEEVKLHEAAEVVISIMGSSSKVEYNPLVTGHNSHNIAANTATAKEILGRQAFTPISDGIRLTAEFFKLKKK